MSTYRRESVRDVMTPEPVTVSSTSSLEQAARRMRDAGIGNVIIMDGEQITGILTDRDIVVRAVAEGTDPSTCKVSDVMTPNVSWLFEDEDVEKAGDLMREKQIRRLAVVDRNKKLVGIVSLGDLAVEGEDEDFAGEVLEGVSEPAHSS